MEDSYGFATELKVKCGHCGFISAEVYSSPRLESKESQRPPFQVNKDMVEAFIEVGKGQSAMKRFSMCMGMNTIGISSYTKFLHSLVEEAKSLKCEILNMASLAVHAAHEDIDPTVASQSVIDVSVSYDGTWMKRGHTSNYGISIVIDILTGIVLDYHILLVGKK